MITLKDENKQIPNGYTFYQPETGWRSRPWSSLRGIAEALVAHRKANPFLIQKHGWSADYHEVYKEVISYNVRICQQMGWMDYLHEVEGAGGRPANVPFLQSPKSLIDRVKGNVAGGETLVEWLTSKEEAVPADQANSRAATCAVCPSNRKAKLGDIFTVAAAAAVMAAYELRRQWKLETPSDNEIGVCDACDCPMKLKVHVPTKWVQKRITQSQFDALDGKCWIRKEKEGLNP
jgi:hypothetical protein